MRLLDSFVGVLPNVALIAVGAVWAIAITPTVLRSIRTRQGGAGIFALWLAGASCILPLALGPALAGELPPLQEAALSFISRLTLVLSWWLALIFVVALLLGYVRPSPAARWLFLLWTVLIISTLIAGQDLSFSIAVFGISGVVASSGLSVAKASLNVKMLLRVLVLGSVLYWMISPELVVQEGGSGRQILGIGQLYGLTAHPNALGPLAAASLVLELATFRRNTLAVVGIVASTVCVIFAQSRNGWACAAIALILLLWNHRRVYTRLAARLAVVPTIVLAFVFQFVNIASQESVSDLTTGRTDIWSGLLPLVGTSPLIGHGAGALSAENRQAYGGVISRYGGQAHNQFLQTAIDSGLVGVGILIVLVVVVVVALSRANHDSRSMLYALCSIVGMSMLVESPLRPVFTGESILLIGVIAIISAPDLELGRRKRFPLGGSIEASPFPIGAKF